MGGRLDPKVWERIANIPERIPRIRDSGPYVDSIRQYGFSMDPRDRTKARGLPLRFQGSDAQLQELLDESNEKRFKADARRPGKDEVRLSKRIVKQEMKLAKAMRELERKLRVAETIEMVAAGKIKKL